MKKLRDVALFVGITYSYSWLVWWGAIGVMKSSASLEGNFYPFLLIGSFGPSLAAIAATWALEGGSAVKQLLGKVFVFRFAIKYYLISLFLAPVVMSVVFFVGGMRTAEPDVTVLAYITLIISPLNGLFSIIGGAGPIGEELGWRGYLLPRLVKRYSLWQTNIILGVVWALWHLPLIITFPTFRNGIALPLYLLLYPLLAIVLSSIMAHIWKWTHGSIFMAIWYHSMVNVMLDYSSDGIWSGDRYAELGLFILIIVSFTITAGLHMWLSQLFQSQAES